MIQVLLVLILVAVNCSFLGVFINLRKLSMLTDAIGHSVLLGIVLGYFIIQDLYSPYFILFATIAGLVTVFLIEKVGQSRLLARQDAIGFVYPILFSLGVILISRYAQNSCCLSTETVVMGEILWVGVDRVSVFGFEFARLGFQLFILLILNLLFVGLNFEALKLSSFDEEFAKVSGIKTNYLSYILMTLLCLTCVLAFKAVGSILVIALFVTPSATVLLFSKKLGQSLWLSVILSIVASSIGYYLAIAWNVSVSGMAALVASVFYLLGLFFHREGIFSQLLR